MNDPIPSHHSLQMHVHAYIDPSRFSHLHLVCKKKKNNIINSIILSTRQIAVAYKLYDKIQSTKTPCHIYFFFLSCFFICCLTTKRYLVQFSSLGIIEHFEIFKMDEKWRKILKKSKRYMYEKQTAHFFCCPYCRHLFHQTMLVQKLHLASMNCLKKSKFKVASKMVEINKKQHPRVAYTLLCFVFNMLILCSY